MVAFRYATKEDRRLGSRSKGIAGWFLNVEDQIMKEEKLALYRGRET